MFDDFIDDLIKSYKPKERKLTRAEKKSIKSINYQRNYKIVNADKVLKYKVSQRFQMAIVKARSRKVEFNLTEERYYQIVNKPCHFCQDKFRVPNEFAIGLYRQDRSKGYVEENIFPVCVKCNVARKNITQKKIII